MNYHDTLKNRAKELQRMADKEEATETASGKLTAVYYRSKAEGIYWALSTFLSDVCGMFPQQYHAAYGDDDEE